MTDRTGSGPSAGGSTDDDAYSAAPADRGPARGTSAGTESEADSGAVRASGGGTVPERVRDGDSGMDRATADGLAEMARGLVPVAERAARGASAAAEPVRVIA
ncbi:hypothetical protein DZF91_24480, partial [Actinomadura logoneensis]